MAVVDAVVSSPLSRCKPYLKPRILSSASPPDRGHVARLPLRPTQSLAEQLIVGIACQSLRAPVTATGRPSLHIRLRHRLSWSPPPPSSNTFYCILNPRSGSTRPLSSLCTPQPHLCRVSISHSHRSRVPPSRRHVSSTAHTSPSQEQCICLESEGSYIHCSCACALDDA